MGDRRYCGGGITAAFCAAFLLVDAQAAEIVPPYPREGALVVTAVSARGAAMVVIPAEAGTWDPNTQSYSWQLQSPVDLVDPETGEFLGALLDGFVRYETGTRYELSFGIGFFAGGQSPTVRAYSPLVEIDRLPQALASARATASVTLTDIGSDGAYLAGVGAPGTGVCIAEYSDGLGSSKQFTHLIGSVQVDSGGTATASATDPQFGYRGLDTDLKTFAGTIAFAVSPSDLAYGSLVYGVHKPADCVGDVDGDWIVDEHDLVLLLAAYDTAEGDAGYDARADFNGDRQVDSADLSVLVSNYGQECYD